MVLDNNIQQDINYEKASFTSHKTKNSTYRKVSVIFIGKHYSLFHFIVKCISILQMEFSRINHGAIWRRMPIRR